MQTPNIELLTRTEIVGLEGTSAGLERVRWRNGRTGQESTRAIRNVFLFLGADPATDWLAGCGVETDRAGFVVTGGHARGNAANPSMYQRAWRVCGRRRAFRLG